MTPGEAEMIRQVLDTRLDGLQRELTDTHSELQVRLDAIQQQTTTTNGRVTALELRQERQKGFMAALAILTPIFTAVIVWALVERIFV